MKEVSMNLNKRNAFTMLELIFVIVVIGILSAVAIPKFAANRDDAVIAKTKATIAAVRSSLATERQKRILRGDFLPITSLQADGGNNVFSTFNADRDGNLNEVLEYAITNCADQGIAQGCWSVAGTTYTFTMPLVGTADFNITNNRFVCEAPASVNCKLLTQ